MNREGKFKDVMVNLYREDVEYAAKKASECGISRSQLIRVALMLFRQQVEMLESRGEQGAFKRLWREIMDNNEPQALA